MYTYKHKQLGEVPLIGADTETFQISEDNIVPHVICLSTAVSPENVNSYDDYMISLIGNDNMENLKDECRRLFTEDVVSVWHNATFDLAAIAVTFPDLLPDIFKALEEGKVKDTLLREKFLNLADHGSIEMLLFRGGNGGRPAFYSLDKLLHQYTGIDISASKEDEDAWRINYYLLDGVPSDDYPKEAFEYAVGDAVYVFPLFDQQERKAQKLRYQGIDPFVTEDFRVMASFCLELIKLAGMRVDPNKVREIRAMMDDLLKPDNFELMLREGVLIPEVPPQPYKTGTRDHQPGCIGHKEHPDFKKTVKDCDCPVKMKKGQKERINQKRLRELIVEIAKVNKDVKVKYTKPSKKFPDGQIRIDKEWMNEYSGFNPILQEYQARQKEIMVVTLYLKKLEDEDGDPVEWIYADYDALKETGRTSSKGSDKYPSWNVQQVDPRVRPSIIPRDGYDILSTDFNSLELVTSSQENINRFGYSRQADVINRGGDAHSYLGSKLALELDEDFRGFIAAEMPDATFDQIYEVFLGFGKSDNEDLRKFFKKFRTLAKPTGLGFPGGMGPATVQGVAMGTYGIKEPLQVFKDIRGFWKSLYPDMKQHLDDINNNRRDPRNSPRTRIDDVTGKKESYDTYRYTTPLGMWRSGCSYTACANGLALQSPGAEGALQAVINVVRACYDPTMESILYGGKYIPTAFIHDEILGEVKDCPQRQEIIREKERLMCEGLDTVTPDVKTGVESALMERWSKYADPVFNDNGDLIPWKPKEEKNGK